MVCGNLQTSEIPVEGYPNIVFTMLNLDANVNDEKVSFSLFLISLVSA